MDRSNRQPMRVVVISGGPAAEHDVSLRSGRAIAAALRESGHAVTTCVVSRDGIWRTGTAMGLGAAITALTGADLAIPALHGPWGEDGGVQGLLESIGVPYVGSGILASATCMDKQRTKLVLAGAGLAVADGRVVSAPVSADQAAELVNELGLPLFVKPLRGGSSYGVTRVTSATGLGTAVIAASAYCDTVLVEREIVGREVDVAVLELPDGTRSAGPALEIQSDPSEPFFSTRAKYGSDRTRFLIPAPVDGGLAEELADLARRAFDALGCAGLARVDFIVDAGRGPVVNEVNTFPGFTVQSQFPRIWQAAGLGFRELVGILVQTALCKAAAPGTAAMRTA